MLEMLEMLTNNTADRVFLTGLWHAPALQLCTVTTAGVVVAANDACIQYIGHDPRDKPLNHMLLATVSTPVPTPLPWWQQPLISYKRTNVLHLVGSRHVLHADGSTRRVQIVAAWQLAAADNQPIVVLAFCDDKQRDVALDSLEQALDRVSQQALADITNWVINSRQQVLAKVS